MTLAFIMIAAVTLDIRWFKNRGKALSELYVSPGYLPLPSAAGTGTEGAGSPYAINNKLGNIERIGLGMVESPEDVILDEDDNLYCGTRHGNIMRFLAPDYQRRSEEHTSELQSLMRISYAVCCLTKKKHT